MPALGGSAPFSEICILTPQGPPKLLMSLRPSRPPVPVWRTSAWNLTGAVPNVASAFLPGPPFCSTGNKSGLKTQTLRMVQNGSGHVLPEHGVQLPTSGEWDLAIRSIAWWVTEFLRSHPSRAVPPPRESGSQLCGALPQASDNPTSIYHCVISMFSSCFSISPTPVEPIPYNKMPNAFSVFFAGSCLKGSPPVPLCFSFFFVLPTLSGLIDGPFRDSV